jgi:hypothetical protein
MATPSERDEKDQLDSLLDEIEAKRLRGVECKDEIAALLDALQLNHGEGYGRSFFSRERRMALLRSIIDRSRSALAGDAADRESTAAAAKD